MACTTSFLYFMTWLALLYGYRGVNCAGNYSKAESCGCNPSCLQDLTTPQDSNPHFAYDSTTKLCVQISPKCDVRFTCRFSSKVLCERVCNGYGTKADTPSRGLSGCANTHNGCCPDGVTVKNDDGTCGRSPEGANPPHAAQGGIQWNLVAVGVCVTVLLVVVLTITGVVTYALRQSQKQRERSRYIQEVLQMYDSDDSTYSTDDSYEDNDPEHNNLFDRL